MTIQDIESYCCGQWIKPDESAISIHSALDGNIVARAGNANLPESDMLDHAREIAGPILRNLTFHERAARLKALATFLTDHKDSLYQCSLHTGATKKDFQIDIDGGIGTLFVMASKAKRELPESKIYLDGAVEHLSRGGTFIGQHIYTSKHGCAVQINAYNFPVWGMLEKFASSFLAGVPSIVKPATVTCYVTELCVRLMLNSGTLPEGAIQLVTGRFNTLLTELDERDSVSFTGSATTASLIRNQCAQANRGVTFTSEQDSLNAAVLGSDVNPNSPEFTLAIDEVVTELTSKSGQKCTAIRRVFVPDSILTLFIQALSSRLDNVFTGDPNDEATTMGPLISIEQKRSVINNARLLAEECVCAKGTLPEPNNIDDAYLEPVIFRCDTPDVAHHVHNTECFGPIVTVMGYHDAQHVAKLLAKGKGSLVASLFTHDVNLAEELVLRAAAWHGRIHINNRDTADESTGHGSPLPHMIHGGPGRAGGGEELGGIRSVLKHMQRTAIQGSPSMISGISSRWIPGATESVKAEHPFTCSFNELAIGDTLRTDQRVITLEDIEHFATFTGDTFYAHMDEEAAKANPFFPGRVAHGYLLLSFAAGLFVEPNEGPVLANTGLDQLRFLKPVVPGDSIYVRLVVKAKTRRNVDYGEIRWDVTINNQDHETVATYELLTMNRF